MTGRCDAYPGACCIAGIVASKGSPPPSGTARTAASTDSPSPSATFRTENSSTVTVTAVPRRIRFIAPRLPLPSRSSEIPGAGGVFSIFQR